MTGTDKRALRQAFGAFPTGVVVVSAIDAQHGGPVGFTANSFTSVSLEPPLLLVCPAKSLSNYRVFSTCSHFAISILSEHQREISEIFSRFKGDRFSRVSWSSDEHDLPVIHGAAAHFSCRTDRSVDAGDHSILIGQVMGFTANAHPGLGFRSGEYFTSAQSCTSHRLALA